MAMPVWKWNLLRRTSVIIPRQRGVNTFKRRNFADASSTHHDDSYEAEKWEKITYAGIATCTILAIYNLSKGHQHYDPPPAYPYLHIRNKEFPWGPDGLFEKKHFDH